MTGSKKILVIEDSEYTREIVQESLRGKGFTVLTAIDGEKGLEAVKETAPDLIVLDMSLPKISGWDLVRHIRQNGNDPGMPVIALTAHAMAGDREKALRIGCSSYLTKPCIPEELIKEINSFFE